MEEVTQEVTQYGIDLIKEIITGITSEKFLGTVLTIVCTVIAIKLLRKFINRIDAKNKDYKGNTIVVIHDILRIIIYIISITTILQINGINTTSLIAGLGVVSTVVAFSLQDAMKDMIMGVHIIYDNFFKIGDVVQIGSYVGVVQDFNIRTTVLKSILDESIINICNRDVSQVVHLANWKDIDLPLSYDEDVDKINEVLTKTSEKIKKIQGIQDCKYLGTQNFEESAITYKIRLYASPDALVYLRRPAIQLIQRELNANNICIPYNQLDIHQIN